MSDRTNELEAIFQSITDGDDAAPVSLTPQEQIEVLQDLYSAQAKQVVMHAESAAAYRSLGLEDDATRQIEFGRKMLAAARIFEKRLADVGAKPKALSAPTAEKTPKTPLNS